MTSQFLNFVSEGEVHVAYMCVCVCVCVCAYVSVYFCVGRTD